MKKNFCAILNSTYNPYFRIEQKAYYKNKVKSEIRKFEITTNVR